MSSVLFSQMRIWWDGKHVFYKTFGMYKNISNVTESSV